MNLYKLHKSPDQLKGHDRAFSLVPALIFKRLLNFSPLKKGEFPLKKGEFEEMMEVMAKHATSEQAFDIARGLNRKIPQLEPLIAENSICAFAYARDVLKGPFPAGEKAISQDTYISYRYAYILKGPFPAGEPEIAKDAYYSYKYANEILKGPFKAGEAAIAKNTEHAYHYAVNILKGRFPAGEAAIMKNNALYSRYKSMVDKTQ